MSGFDPETYQRTTRTQWQDTAEAWRRWGPTIEEWLAPATQGMLDAAGITAGSRVLDVAAGAGGQSLAAAGRTGPTGHVLATDIAPAILEWPPRRPPMPVSAMSLPASWTVHQMLAGLPEPERQAAWTEIGEALGQFEGPEGFVAPCEMLVVSGTR